MATAYSPLKAKFARILVRVVRQRKDIRDEIWR